MTLLLKGLSAVNEISRNGTCFLTIVSNETNNLSVEFSITKIKSMHYKSNLIGVGGQMVLNLATTGKAAFPIWMEAHSGNGSDSKILPASVEKIDAHCKLLAEAPDFIHVADSAMYEGCQKISRSIKWLSRVPERSKEAKAYLPTSALFL